MQGLFFFSNKRNLFSYQIKIAFTKRMLNIEEENLLI